MSKARNLDALIAQVASGGLQTREEAASKLFQLPSGELVEFLFARIEAKNFRERNAAIELVGRLGPAAWEEIAPRVERLSNEGKMFVAPVFADFRDPRTLAVLHSWAVSKNPNLAATVCDTLAKIADPSSIPVLRDLANADIWMAGPALTALGRIGRPEVVPILEQYLADDDLRPFAVGALATVAHPDAWGPLSRGVREDETLAGIALENAEPLFKKLPLSLVRRYAQPKNVWVFAAREGLKNVNARLASAKIIAALEDTGSLRKLIEIYLFEADDDVLRDAVCAMPTSREVIDEYAARLLGDEATRRLVQLMLSGGGGKIDTSLRFLAHPAAAVRLEMVLGLRRYVKSRAGLFASLLNDPDDVVRTTALQALRDNWHEPEVMQKIAAEIDFASMPQDTILLLTREAPEPIPRLIREYLGGLGSRRRSDQESVHRLLELRANPKAAIERLTREPNKKAWQTDEITALGSVDDASVVQLLTDLLRDRDELVRYLAAETLVAHKLTTKHDVERGLRSCKDPGVVAALTSFGAATRDNSFSDADYVQFREFVRERTGIVYNAPRRQIFENRLDSRLRALGLADPRAYYRYLTYHSDRQDEFLRLVSALTNNETFFFRERTTLDAVISRARDKLAKTGPSAARFRILSAGASSGEELGSIAMLAKDSGIDLERLELFGVDIDVAMVNSAQAGLYRNKSFRSTDPEHLVRFFVPEGEHRRLKPSIHRLLNFRWANLVEAATLQFPRPFDVILCRNVLIYFDTPTVERVVRTLHGLLAKDGIMMTGVSESLASVPFLFDPVRKDGVVQYIKTPLK